MTCPKQMVYGPCAGVTAEGGCEVDAALPCPFVDAPTVRWVGPVATAAPAEGSPTRPRTPGADDATRASASGTAGAAATRASMSGAAARRRPGRP